MIIIYNKKGQVASAIVAGIVAITIAVILIAQVFFPQVFGANQSGWDTATINIWNTVALAGAIGLMVLTFRVFGII